jgi:LmbE family N-acetylglucosaminyl deacetylase
LLAACVLAGTAVAALATAQSIPQETSAAVAWERLLKLKNPASVMHITAHPDDEHGGVLAKLSRGDGARLSLLTLTRGESGDNAIGPELFDALGLIRTEELRVAGRYYGVDEQYFTTMVDYGYSKRLDETFSKWNREDALGDVVRIIRTSRPWIILSRFQGNERDGHGNHSAAGVLAADAFHAAGDPERFPEQIKDGLRPWQPYKLYIGGLREGEDWNARIDASTYSPWLGETYDNIARYGLSFQRSQNGGRFFPAAGPSVWLYRRTAVAPGKLPVVRPKEPSIFDGLPSSYAVLLGPDAEAIDLTVRRAMEVFSLKEPWASVPALAEGLAAVRGLLAARAGDAEATFTLRIKERQFEDAINAALALRLTALTEPAAMSAPVPGQTFTVTARLDNRSGVAISAIEPGAPLVHLTGDAGWNITSDKENSFSVTLADDVPLSTKPYYSRGGLQESRYRLDDPSQFGRPTPAPPLSAVARYRVNGVDVELREPVRRREARLPYGEVLCEVRSVPRLAVALSPSAAIVPLPASRPIDLEVSLVHNAPDATEGHVALEMPRGWIAKPVSRAFSFARAGERASFSFSVTPTSIGAQSVTVHAVASTHGGKKYRQGFELIDHRDLEVRYLYRDASTTVRGVKVDTLPGLKVGYVMGLGDQVPASLRQLGAQVTLLRSEDLAAGTLSAFDTIMVGTRAYAVRSDLRTYNQRLLEYVKSGGNMIVLYNTLEFDPNVFAPYPGELPRNAEEVSEEDSPVSILSPGEQSFKWPNQITVADFDGWVEQRGSKFFTTWSDRYRPMISTHDTGQAPQRGGWLTAKFGKGTWTYFAYALHRQLPYGVPGAYRITANLLALGKTPR